VLSVVRRELRRISPSVRIESDEIEEVLRADVLKRDALEGDKAEAAAKAVSKAAKNALRETKHDDGQPADKV